MNNLLDPMLFAPPKLFFAVAAGVLSGILFLLYIRKSDDFEVPLIPKDTKLFWGIILGLFSAGFLLSYFLDKWR